MTLCTAVSLFISNLFVKLEAHCFGLFNSFAASAVRRLSAAARSAGPGGVSGGRNLKKNEGWDVFTDVCFELPCGLDLVSVTRMGIRFGLDPTSVLHSS